MDILDLSAHRYMIADILNVNIFALGIIVCVDDDKIYNKII